MLPPLYAPPVEFLPVVSNRTTRAGPLRHAIPQFAAGAHVERDAESDRSTLGSIFKEAGVGSIPNPIGKEFRPYPKGDDQQKKGRRCPERDGTCVAFDGSDQRQHSDSRRFAYCNSIGSVAKWPRTPARARIVITAPQKGHVAASPRIDPSKYPHSTRSTPLARVVRKNETLRETQHKKARGAAQAQFGRYHLSRVIAIGY
jgi:hypothetical protein